MAILVFAGVLSVPSAVFAEASWYGSLRGGLNVGGGNDAKFFDGGSRWGIKGSNEAGEGLTAVYRFEHKISTTNGGQPGGRLAYVGLTGGFGSLTMGQIWNAAYNHAGSITDQSYYFGDSGTGYRHGNALSYAYSAGAVGFQLDLISDGGSDTGKAVDKTEFGMTIGLGEIGRIAIAHTNKRDTMKMSMAMPETYTVTASEAPARKIDVIYAANDSSNVADGELNASGLDAIRFVDGMYRVDSAGSECNAIDPDAADACMTATAYVSVETTYSDATNAVTVGEVQNFHLPASITTTAATDAMSVVDARGHKSTHVAVQFSVGGISPYIGYSEKKMNGSTAESKTTHYGMSGSLGDTGMSYLVAARNVKAASGKKSSPWLVNVSRSLGGGATVIFEHGNNDDGKSGQSRVGLHVGF